MTGADLELADAHAARLDVVAQSHLGRSLALFHAEAGDCGGCALELAALRGTIQGLRRFGIGFVASPRHADVLLITGVVTRPLAEPLRRTWEAMADPKWVIAVGHCARGGGPFAGSYATVGGVAEVMPVDLVIPGCPPAPSEILRALTALIEAAA